MSNPPRDSLVRASIGGFELRDSGEGMPVIHGHGAIFNQWTKIDSLYEGTFLERIAPGAFKKTIAENRPNMRMLFNHGQDPQIGDKPIAPFDELAEDATGLVYSGRMLDTSYNRDLIPGLKAGLYGSSFRFRVVKEDFNQRAKVSDWNPDGLPERTVQEAAVYEMGPVTFPAYIGADAGMRSETDEYILATLAANPERLARLVANVAKVRSLNDVATALLADKGALQVAVDKLGKGENLTKAEAELLEAAIDQLEPPSCCVCCLSGCICCGWECQGEACCAITNSKAEVPETNSAPKDGAERAHSKEPAVVATPEAIPTPVRKAPPISRDTFLAQLQENNNARSSKPR